MLLHADQGFRGEVWDLDTGRKVLKVISLDEEAGLLEAYKVLDDGKIARDVNGNYLTYRARGRFRCVPMGHRDYGRHRLPITPRPASAPGAVACVKCGSALTLPGSELCAFCNARDKGVEFRVEKIVTPLLDRPCQSKGCRRLAEWAVGDEVRASPQLGPSPGKVEGRRVFSDRVWFERGTCVGRRFYCSFHYQPPRLLAPNGERIEDLGSSGRPD